MDEQDRPPEPRVVILGPRRTRVPAGVDVGLGLLVTGARAGTSALRLALAPARALARSPGLRAQERRLAATGRDAAERGRRVLEGAVEDAVTSPVVSRTV